MWFLVPSGGIGARLHSWPRFLVDRRRAVRPPASEKRLSAGKPVERSAIRVHQAMEGNHAQSSRIPTC